MALVHGAIGAPGPDRHLSPALERVRAMVRSGELLAVAEAVAGPLR